MSSRADHYRTAEQLLAQARSKARALTLQDEVSTIKEIEELEINLATAQVHATLANVHSDVEDEAQGL